MSEDRGSKAMTSVTRCGRLGNYSRAFNGKKRQESLCSRNLACVKPVSLSLSLRCPKVLDFWELFRMCLRHHRVGVVACWLLGCLRPHCKHPLFLSCSDPDALLTGRADCVWLRKECTAHGARFIHGLVAARRHFRLLFSRDFRECCL